VAGRRRHADLSQPRRTSARFRTQRASIGNFDGVHFGHRRILRRVKEIAHSALEGLGADFRSAPYPRGGARRTPPLLTSPERRAALMREEGIQQVLILPFTRELAMLTRRTSSNNWLVNALGARAVLVGDNFRFGHRQAGNVAVLAGLGRKFGFETEVVPAVAWRGAWSLAAAFAS